MIGYSLGSLYMTSLSDVGTVRRERRRCRICGTTEDLRPERRICRACYRTQKREQYWRNKERAE